MTAANPNQFGAPLGEEEVYMEQEEEWEREGLLDPAWEKQQRKVNDIIIKHIFKVVFCDLAAHGMNFLRTSLSMRKQVLESQVFLPRLRSSCVVHDHPLPEMKWPTCRASKAQRLFFNSISGHQKFLTY